MIKQNLYHTVISVKSSPGKLRWLLAVGFFIIGLIAYMDRANISIVAESMMQDLSITKVQFGFLGALFSLGYAIAQIPGGMLAERFGSRLIVTIALFAWSIFTILTVVAPTYFILCIVRFFFGVGEAPIYPGNAVFNTNWFTQSEKARAAGFLLAGSYFGPVIAPTLTVFIMIHLHWHAVFYLFGLTGLVIAAIWYIISRNSPEQHPWISLAEKDYICSDRTIGHGVKVNSKTPWKLFIKKVDFWAVGLQYFFVVYMTTLFMVWLPVYLQEARGFSLTHMGIAASFPWLAICITVLTAGTISDKLLKHGYSQLVARGYIAIIGFILFIGGITATVLTSNAMISVIWLTVTMGALGLPVVTSWAIVADKGQEYAGSASGWMNLWGNLGGVVSPVMCGYLAQNFGWNTALLFNIIPISIAIICWFFIKPDIPFSKNMVSK